VAVLIHSSQRENELRHLIQLCEQHGVAAPASGTTPFSVTLRAGLRLKWERHGEFSSYGIHADGPEPQSFESPAAALLPSGWLAGIPGRTIAALHASVQQHPDPGVPDAPKLSAMFGGHAVAGSEVAHDAGVACTDFLTRDDGYLRVLLLDRSLTPNQTGRVLQRLFEIESYRMMALLATSSGAPPVAADSCHRARARGIDRWHWQRQG
jgi:uncharacterized membrane-anchored protein